MRLSSLRLGMITSNIYVDPYDNMLIVLSDIDMPPISDLASHFRFAKLLYAPPVITLNRTWPLRVPSVSKLRVVRNLNTLNSTKLSAIFDLQPILKQAVTFYGDNFVRSPYKTFAHTLLRYSREFRRPYRWFVFLTDTKKWNEMNVNLTTLRRSVLYLCTYLLGVDVESEDESLSEVSVKGIEGMLVGVYDQASNKITFFCVYKHNRSVFPRVPTFIRNVIHREQASEELTPLSPPKTESVSVTTRKLSNLPISKKAVVDSIVRDAIDVVGDFLGEPNTTSRVKDTVVGKALAWALTGKKREITPQETKELVSSVAKLDTATLKLVKARTELSTRIPNTFGPPVTVGVLTRKDSHIKAALESFRLPKGIGWVVEDISVKPYTSTTEVARSTIDLGTFIFKNEETNQRVAVELFIPRIDKDGFFYYNGNKYVFRHVLVPKTITVPRLLTAKFNNTITFFEIYLRRIQSRTTFYLNMLGNRLPLIQVLLALFPLRDILNTFGIKHLLAERELKIGKDTLIIDSALCEFLFNGLEIGGKTPKTLDLGEWSQFLVSKTRDTGILRKLAREFSLIFDNVFALEAKSLDLSTPLDVVKYMCELAMSGEMTLSTELSNYRIRTSGLDEALIRMLARFFASMPSIEKLPIGRFALIRYLLREGWLMSASEGNPLELLRDLCSVTNVSVGSFATPMTRSFHRSYMGVLDPVDTPSGDTIGVVQRLTLTSRITPTLELDTTSTSYPFSWAVSTVPFARFNDGNRLQMAANHVRQAVPLTYAEPPYVITGIESAIRKVAGLDIRTTVDGVVESIKPEDVIVIKTSSNRRFEFRLTPFVTSHNFVVHWVPTIKIGTKVKEGDIIATAEELHFRDDLTLGTNLYTAFIPSLDVFEDAVVISESAAERLTVTKGNKVVLKLPSDSTLLHVASDKKIKKGDALVVLAGKGLRVDTLLDEFEKQDVVFETQERKVFIRVPEDVDVMRVMVHTTANYLSANKILADYVKQLPADDFTVRNALTYKGDRYGCVICFYIKWKAPVTLGDKLTNRHGNKGVVCKIQSLQEMPRDEKGRPFELVLNPLGVVGRMNLGQMLELYASNIVRYYNDLLMKENYSQKAITTLERILTALDKTSNKAVVAYGLSKAKQKAFVPLVIPMFKEPTWNDLRRIVRDLGISTTSHVIWKDTQSYTEVPIGYMYVYKLYHESSSKESARAIGGYQTLGHAIRGRSRIGGQKIDEQMSWTLLGRDLDAVTKELFAYPADVGPQIFNKIVENGSVSLAELSIPNRNREYLQSILVSLGVELK